MTFSNGLEFNFYKKKTLLWVLWPLQSITETGIIKIIGHTIQLFKMYLAAQ